MLKSLRVSHTLGTILDHHAETMNAVSLGADMKHTDKGKWQKSPTVKLSGGTRQEEHGR